MAVGASLGAFGGCWAALATVAPPLDAGIDIGVASVPLVILLAVLGAWAGRGRENRTEVPGTTAHTEYSMLEQVVGPSSTGVVIGPNAVFNLAAERPPPNKAVAADEAQDPSSTDIAMLREPGLADSRSTLRSRILSFTGREDDLAALAMARGTTTLTGLGGVGKSTLALEYAHRRYAAGEVCLAWWFVAENRPVLLTRMSQLYDRLTGARNSGDDAEGGAIALRNWLSSRTYPWIAVFDNAEPGTLDGILPESAVGQVIITSRISDWPDVGAKRVVERLPPDQAIDLLVRLAARPNVDGAPREITEELGGLALAIEKAATFIRQAKVSYQGYLNDVRSDSWAVLDARLSPSDSIAARVWHGSVARVTGGRADHPAAILLGIMSYLAPDDIPRQILSPAVVRTVPALADIGMTRLTIAQAELAAYSLITIDDKREVMSVHRVIQGITRLDAELNGRSAFYCTAAIDLLSACV